MGKRQWADLRLRLVAWYTLLSGFTLLAFDTYLYFQFRERLYQQIDQTLELAALQAINNIDDGHNHGSDHDINDWQDDDDDEKDDDDEDDEEEKDDDDDEKETPNSTPLSPDYEEREITFDPRRDAPALAEKLDRAGVSVYLLGLDGSIKGHFGRTLDEAHSKDLKAGFATQSDGGELWRIYTRSFPLRGNEPRGWIKIAHSLSSVEGVMNSLKQQILLRIPIVLMLMGIGGLILTHRALRPLAKITRTAHQVWLSGDLTQRISYQGTADELGRLAIMFDEMLNSLQRTFEREQRFNADVSHELRTPLAAMKGRLSVALSQARTPADYEATLRAFEQEVDRLIRLSSDLLLLSRLEQGALQGETESLDLGELLAAIGDQMQPLADLKSLTFQTVLPSGLKIQAQPDHLIRLFLNLVDNAIKHTPPHGKVTLLASQVNHHAKVIVRDTGPGITAEHLPHLFERFYRVESDRSRRTGGVGLGLAIAYEIAQFYGGTLSVESQCQQGTTFTVTLPLKTSH